MAWGLRWMLGVAMGLNCGEVKSWQVMYEPLDEIKSNAYKFDRSLDPKSISSARCVRYRLFP